MAKKYIQQASAFGLLVLLAVAARLWFRDIPNFAPVAAVALFAGYLFRSAVLATAVPLTVLAISDFFIGGYELPVMVAVYGSLTAPVVLRRFLRGRLQWDGGRKMTKSMLTIAGSGLGCSIFFFLVTNFAVWATWYHANPESLISCYVQAWPFFRYTLLGDLAFAATLFGSLAVYVNCIAARHATEVELAPEPC